MSILSFATKSRQRLPHPDSGHQRYTHFNGYGAYELARSVVDRIREVNLPIAKFLNKDISDFNPAHADSQPSFRLSATSIFLRPDVMRVGQTWTCNR